MHTKNLKILSTGLAAVFVFLLILLHFLDVSVGFKTDLVSNFALGRFGWLFSLTVTILSISKYFLSVLIGNIQYKKSLAKWIRIFVLFSAITNFLIGVFPTDTGSDSTLTGYLHVIFAYLSFIATGIFLSLFVFLNNGQSDFKIYLKGLICVVYLSFLVSFPFLGKDWSPIVERILILLVTVGIVVNTALVEKIDE